MRKTLAILAAVLMLLPAMAAAETIVASFYPIYALTVNLLDGLEDEIELTTLATPDTGCLHDYQLSTGDMKALSQADAFLICGAGMESYLDMVYDAFPALPVVEAAEGIELIDDDGEAHEHAEASGHHHDHEEVNAHVWLDVANAEAMVRNICAGLCELLPQYAERLNANCDAYLVRLDTLDQDLHEGLAHVNRRDIVTFHEAFPYFAKAYGLHVAAVVNQEPGDALSPAALSRLISTVAALGNPPLFTEPQYDSIAAQTVAAETGARIYELDPVVTGPRTRPEALTAYENAMRNNLAVLQEALN